MSDEKILKILTVSLMGSSKSKAYAVFNGEQLSIVSVRPISGAFNTWRKPLIEEIKEKGAKGYVILVEEKTDLIAQYGTQYLLEDVEERSNLYEALDWYFALQDMGNLISDDEVKRFIIRAGGEGQKVEKKQDEKGRPYYSIEWASFSGGHRAVLLCVVAAMTEPLSDRFLEAMYGKLPEPPEDDNPVRRYQKLFEQMDIQKEIALGEARKKRAGRGA